MDDLQGFWENYWVDAKVESKNKVEGFLSKPPEASEFFDKWVNMSLFPKQLEVVKNTFSNDYKDLNSDYNEYVLAWGKRSGKDVLVSNLLDYLVVWLLHTDNPQKYLGLKDGEPIDIVNVSFDAEQAESVFFEKFTRAIKTTINPKTGKNFFEEQGMNFKRDILNNSVKFPKNIRAFSLNSASWKAEGKNTIFAVFDEIGSFRFDRAQEIRKHIRTTARTTCHKFHKLFYISFLTSANDYMAYLLDRAEKGESKNTYCDRAATWEVRSIIEAPEHLKQFAVIKENYQDDYDEDPETSMLMYECKVPKFTANSFIRQPAKVLGCIGNLGDKDHLRNDPRIIHDKTYSYDLMDEEFEPWFKPYYTEYIYTLEKEYEKYPSEQTANLVKFEKEKHQNAEYYVHIDLSRGVVDCAGITLLHKYYVLETPKIYVDLMCQIRANKEENESAEIDISKILDFVLKLKKQFKFPIVKLTADGWNSALFLNICEKNDISAEIVSLERTMEPYETLKDYIYKTDIDFYYYPTIIRELKELIITDKKKIDHPRKSQWRQKEEGISDGSKDIADSIAGACWAASQSDDSEPMIFNAK